MTCSSLREQRWLFWSFLNHCSILKHFKTSSFGKKPCLVSLIQGRCLDHIRSEASNLIIHTFPYITLDQIRNYPERISVINAYINTFTLHTSTLKNKRRLWQTNFVTNDSLSYLLDTARKALVKKNIQKSQNRT